MKKVITYGTYDLLHYGHIRLLERAKALGDYLIVAVTSDDYDKARGKINVKQSLIERIEAVRETGLADEIIVEEYEGQKIDDIIRYNVDIFTVGSDWKGKFDYLNDYCKVVYLDRTEGVSSSDIRSANSKLKLGLVGNNDFILKFINECSFVNGILVSAVMTNSTDIFNKKIKSNIKNVSEYQKLLDEVDAVFIASHPTLHYTHIKQALMRGKHVLCESPITLKLSEYKELEEIAKKNNCILMNSIKTAYSTAYYRLLLLIKSGKIGDVISVDSTCTSLRKIDYKDENVLDQTWNSICGWGPTAMLPIFQILGTNYSKYNIFSLYGNESKKFDIFTKVAFEYPNAVASIKVGKGIKSEGELVISGTKGYIYVPSPWWKTDYFEVRYEKMSMNERYFYKLDGEGIRYELVYFLKKIEKKVNHFYVDDNVTCSIINIIESFYKK